MDLQLHTQFRRPLVIFANDIRIPQVISKLSASHLQFCKQLLNHFCKQFLQQLLQEVFETSF